MIHEALDILFRNYRMTFIKWPTGTNATEVMDGFEAKRGLRGVIGAIDGSHVPIAAPLQVPEDYVNRKGFHSLILQATCDHELRITDAYTGWPGSVHDARVFKNSDLFQKIQENPENVCPAGSYLLGDAAYPLTEYVITPFRRTGVPFTAEQTNFNFLHSSTRMSIEKTFGLLKGRFRRLKFINVRKFFLWTFCLGYLSLQYTT